MTYSIFAIYFKERCLYVGYSSNISNYLKELKKRKTYEEKRIKKNPSISLLAFLLFYQENYEECLTITFDTDLDLSRAQQIKKDYIKKLNPLFND